MHRSKVFCFWVAQVFESLGVHSEPRKVLAHVGKDIVLDKCADSPFLFLWHIHIIKRLSCPNHKLSEASLLISISMDIHNFQRISNHCLNLLISV